MLGSGYRRVTYATAPPSTGVNYAMGLGSAYVSLIVLSTTSYQSDELHSVTQYRFYRPAKDMPYAKPCVGERDPFEIQL